MFTILKIEIFIESYSTCSKPTSFFWLKRRLFALHSTTQSKLWSVSFPHSWSTGLTLLKKKQLYSPFFLWMGFNCLKATATSRRQFTFYHLVPRNSWYSFYRTRKDERLSRPCNNPVVFNTGPLDWESSALTTRPLLICKYRGVLEII